eukprot:gene21861-28891_t
MVTGQAILPGCSSMDQLWLISNTIAELTPRQRVLMELNGLGKLNYAGGHDLSQLPQWGPNFDSAMMQVLKNCLDPETKKRLSAHQILQLPYFHDIEEVQARVAATNRSWAATQGSPPPTNATHRPTRSTPTDQRNPPTNPTNLHQTNATHRPTRPTSTNQPTNATPVGTAKLFRSRSRDLKGRLQVFTARVQNNYTDANGPEVDLKVPMRQESLAGSLQSEATYHLDEQLSTHRLPPKVGSKNDKTPPSNFEAQLSASDMTTHELTAHGLPPKVGSKTDEIPPCYFEAQLSAHELSTHELSIHRLLDKVGGKTDKPPSCSFEAQLSAHELATRELTTHEPTMHRLPPKARLPMRKLTTREPTMHRLPFKVGSKTDEPPPSYLEARLPTRKLTTHEPTLRRLPPKVGRKTDEPPPCYLEDQLPMRELPTQELTTHRLPPEVGSKTDETPPSNFEVRLSAQKLSTHQPNLMDEIKTDNAAGLRVSTVAPEVVVSAPGQKGLCLSEESLTEPVKSEVDRFPVKPSGWVNCFQRLLTTLRRVLRLEVTSQLRFSCNLQFKSRLQQNQASGNISIVNTSIKHLVKPGSATVRYD